MKTMQTIKLTCCPCGGVWSGGGRVGGLWGRLVVGGSGGGRRRRSAGEGECVRRGDRSRRGREMRTGQSGRMLQRVLVLVGVRRPERAPRVVATHP